MNTLPERWLLLLLLLVQLVLEVLGLVVIAPLVLISVVTDGRCLLYMSAKDMTASVIPCSYVVAVTVMLQIIYCTLRSVFLLLQLLRVINKNLLPLRTTVITWTVVDLLCLLLILAAAGVLSSGFNKLCNFIDSMENSAHVCPLGFRQVAAWVSVVVWMLLVGTDILSCFAQEIPVCGWSWMKSQSPSKVYEELRSVALTKTSTATTVGYDLFARGGRTVYNVVKEHYGCGVDDRKCSSVFGTSLRAASSLWAFDSRSAVTDTGR
ncbi:hypothetical protein C0Q70_14171 [Pomacea canaliculata]|uniref:Uncharacterized protein n=1 Tax=Pomacea canaliculata TaxID=400727 RepID=A0A2T7NZ82_POMCA|nr:hypothetical protein C0Q70_14171 [Pomacea canaliculata]